MIPWTEDEKSLLARVWHSRCSLKVLAAQYFPARTSESLKGMGVRLGLPMNRGSRKYCRSMAPGAKLIWEALQRNESLTCYEIETIVGSISIQTAQEYVRRWLPEGKIHIAAWRRRSHDGQWSAAYRIGAGENAPRPSPKPSALSSRERYARMVGMKKTANPFLAAAGMAHVPAGRAGRVYRDAEMTEERSAR